MNDYFLHSDIYCDFMNNAGWQAIDDLYLHLGVFDGDWTKHSKHNTYTADFVSGNVRGDEKIVEVSYNYTLPYGIRFMPDIQYVIHPNGALNFDDTLIAGMKLDLNF